MTVLKTKTKKGYGTVTFEHVTVKDAQKPGVTYTGYEVKKNGKSIGMLYGNKKDAMKSFKYECMATFGTSTIDKRHTVPW
ncbi:MAG: hypothetical protein WCX79_00140 [Candidatus Paceibacterota bacterium]|jgi:hypothetical protein